MRLVDKLIIIKKQLIHSKKNTNEIHVTYETDNIEQAKLVAAKNKNISVVYHDTNVIISPVLTLIINGHSFTKWNPEYIEYLKQKNPEITDTEIAKCIEEALINNIPKNNNFPQSNTIGTTETKTYKITRK